MLAYRFEMPKDKGPRRCSIKSITIKETGGTEEAAASAIAEAKGKSGSVAIETIRLSIVAVDDKPVSQPFGDLDSWNTRTRRLVAKFWESINGTDDGEAESFIEAATPVESKPGVSGGATTGEDG